jgi:hypothetical protein
MSALSIHLERLLRSLESAGLQPPSQDVRIIEVDYTTFDIDDGTYHAHRDELRTLLEYENRFDELLQTGYSWLNLSCYGVYEGFLIVAVEVPSATVPPDNKARNLYPGCTTSVNLSGPNHTVLEHDWHVDLILTIV